MRFLPTFFHGFLDYAAGLLLLTSPWLFNFDNTGLPQWIAVGAGAALLVVSLCTRYELGVVRAIPMHTPAAGFFSRRPSCSVAVAAGF